MQLSHQMEMNAVIVPGVQSKSRCFRPSLRGRWDNSSVLLGVIVQVIHPAHISSLLGQLSDVQKLGRDDLTSQQMSEAECLETVEMVLRWYRKNVGHSFIRPSCVIYNPHSVFGPFKM